MLRRGVEPRMPIEFTSQYGEDLLAWDLLGGPSSGFFIEAGAFDGYRYSVTYPFEAVGWTGLLVEAIPAVCRRCVERRPFSRVVNAALSHRNVVGQVEFTIIADAFGGMMSHAAGLGYVPADAVIGRETVRVPATNLNTLLASHEGEIDLVVLDVEGAEPDVLDGFDVARYRQRLMLIETNEAARIQGLVMRHGYTQVGQVESNLVFVRNDQAEVLERVKWMRF